MSKGTPEQQLLFTVLRLDQASEAHLHSLLSGGFDLPALEALAAEHNVIACAAARSMCLTWQWFPSKLID